MADAVHGVSSMTKLVAFGGCWPACNKLCGLLERLKPMGCVVPRKLRGAASAASLTRTCACMEMGPSLREKRERRETPRISQKPLKALGLGLMLRVRVLSARRRRRANNFYSSLCIGHPPRAPNRRAPALFSIPRFPISLRPRISCGLSGFAAHEKRTPLFRGALSPITTAAR